MSLNFSFKKIKLSAASHSGSQTAAFEFKRCTGLHLVPPGIVRGLECIFFKKEKENPNISR